MSSYNLKATRGPWTDLNSSYWHRLYHSTTFVLHRKGPLCPLPSPESLALCIRSAGAYIDAISQVLRSSNVPQSWMLIQGVLSAGLTMLISARANFKLLDWTLLLVDLPAWSRKCSVCLAIMNERWQQDLLSELETHVEILTDETLRFISSGLAAERVRSGSREITQAEVSASQDIGMGSGSLGHPLEPVSDGQASQVEPGLTGTDPTVQWEPLGAFSEFLGADFMDTYWDMQDLEATFDSSFQNPDPARQNGAFFDM